MKWIAATRQPKRRKETSACDDRNPKEVNEKINKSKKAHIQKPKNKTEKKKKMWINYDIYVYQKDDDDETKIERNEIISGSSIVTNSLWTAQKLATMIRFRNILAVCSPNECFEIGWFVSNFQLFVYFFIWLSVESRGTFSVRFYFSFSFNRAQIVFKKTDVRLWKLWFGHTHLHSTLYLNIFDISY